VDSIWVHIRDVRKARAFYRDALGLKELHYDEKSEHASYRLPHGPPLSMHKQAKGEPGRPAGTVSGIYLRVADVKRAARDVERRGGRVTDPPAKMPWGKWNATVADPDGNEFVLTD
jgi:predicted enzyme related to lactoylglutathione lyase